MVRLVEGRLLHECCLWQKWIHTAGSDGGPFDIRALVQKDGDGVWNIRGKGVREGRKGNITSNVAKGGILHAFDDYIAARFGGEFARLLDRQIDLIALLAARHLERKSGRRLVELGFDLALDHTGHPWILEVNVKPGRKVIRRLYGNGMARTCETAPFLYARHLLNRRHGRPPRPVSRRSDRE